MEGNRKLGAGQYQTGYKETRLPFVKSVAELITKYKQEKIMYNKPKHNVELEIRVQSDIALFKATLERIRAEPILSQEIENSVDLISSQDADAKQIRHMLIKNNTVAKTEYRTKRRLLQPYTMTTDGYQYRIGLALEISDTPEFKAEQSDILRVKSRLSIILTDAPDWRIDFTIVRAGQLSAIGQILGDLKTKMFRVDMTPETYPAQYIEPGTYEIEIEYIGKDNPTEDSFSVADRVLNVAPANARANTESRRLAILIDSRATGDTLSIKRILNQALPLTKSDWSRIWPPVGWFVTDKAEGLRAAIIIDKNGTLILRANEVLEAPLPRADDVIVLDAEMIGATAHCFDIMVIDGKTITDLPFEQRLAHLLEIETRIFDNIQVKKYYRLETPFEPQFRAAYEAKHPYEIDGLIITSPDKNYFDTENYKWKPIEHLTIDFLARKCPESALGHGYYAIKPNHDLYLLFVGMRQDMRRASRMTFPPYYKALFPEIDSSGAQYLPMLFRPSANPNAYLYYHPTANNHDLNGKIVELGSATGEAAKDSSWRLVRIREDRAGEKNYYGNDFKTAEFVYANFADPFPITDLWKKPEGYFGETGSSTYVAANRYRRYVISRIMQANMSEATWIIDEAGGRGADLPRYESLDVKNVLFMEIDASAIAELTQRKHTRADKGSSRTAIYTYVVDLKTSAAILEAGVAKYGVMAKMADAIVCNFAIHYFCDTMANLRNLLTFNAKMLKKGGIFMFTTMSGELIYDALKDVGRGESWVLEEDGKIKYALRKDYAPGPLMPVGQMIAVKLPFADQMYSEPLCNIAAVIAEAKKHGFVLELNENFQTYLDEYKKDAAKFHSAISEVDEQYNALFQIVTLRCTK